MSQSERQRKLLNTLRRRRFDTINNLAQEFDVSPRTIQRDIVDLMRYYPIETVRGRYTGGVRYIDSTFRDCQFRENMALNSEQVAVLMKARAFFCGRELSILDGIIVLLCH